jgi:hypothetical protein
MLKIVFFLVVGAFVLGAALGILVFSLQFLGYVLVHLFNFLAWVYKRLELAFGWVNARWQARLKLADTPAANIPSLQEQVDVPTPKAETPVIPVLESPELVQAEVVEPIESSGTAQAVTHGETPIEAAQPELETVEEPIEPPVVTSPEPDLPGEPEPKIESSPTEAPMPEDAPVKHPPAEVIVSPPIIPSHEPEPAPTFVSPKPAAPIAKPNPPKAPASKVPIIPARPPANLPPARPMFPQLPDFVGIGRRRFRLMVEKDHDGRPGMVIICQLLGAFKEGWREPIRITVTAQEFSDGKHHPLIRLGNLDFNPANPDVMRDFPDGALFGFREWTTVSRINLNDFEGHGSGSSQLEVTCRGWELRDLGDLGDLIFEETEALRAVLVTGGYFARKQRRVEQLKAVVVVLRLFVCLDGGERNITNRLNKHFEAVGARFLRRWVAGDIALRDLINVEFTRRLQGSRLPTDIATSAKLSDAPKDLRDWLHLECGEISEDFKPQTPDGEAVKQLATLSKLLGGP